MFTRRSRSALLTVPAALVLLACGADPAAPADTLDFTGTWNPSSNFGGPWGHDGEPYATERFIVFSGSASQSARRLAAELGEEVLDELMGAFDVTMSAFDFLPSYDEPKIHYLVLKDQEIINANAIAYRDGLVTISRDSPKWIEWRYQDSWYKQVVKHELTHVIESLLIGDPQFTLASDLWWREGIANLTAGPWPSAITTRAGVEEWRASHEHLPGGGNPVAIHRGADFPPEVVSAGETFTYYDMFELTVRYVLDRTGLGVDYTEVPAFYDMLGSGVSFGNALDATYGIGLPELETNYWDVILAYVDLLNP